MMYDTIPAEAEVVRREVFIDEQGFFFEFDDIDPVARHSVLFYDGVPAATGRVYRTYGEGFPDGCYTIGRVAVRKPFRKLGLGTLVMQELENKARELGAKALHVSAQMQAMEFYERCGFFTRGESYFDEHVRHVAMIKPLVEKTEAELADDAKERSLLIR